jgi:hypothetical protein
MHPAPSLDIREYRPGDEEAIVAAFNRVFAATRPGFRTRRLDGWRWRFVDNPSIPSGGPRAFLAFDEEGQVLAQYAGLSQRALVEGRSVHFSHSVDSFCDPALRGGIGKRGVFVQTGEPFAENYGGQDVDSDVFMWGLPVRTAWRIGRARLGYEFLDPLWTLTLESSKPSESEARGVEVSDAAEFPADTDEFFTRCARDHAAIVVRDREHLAWRYTRCPEVRYQIAIARARGHMLGYAVHRLGEIDGRPAQVICDWLVMRADNGPAQALRAYLQSWASDVGLPLVCAFPSHTPEFVDFQAAGYKVAGSRTRCVVGRSYDRRRSARWYSQNLYATLGDTDLV